ncbi:MAG: J domain-containing protein [Archangium sp.]
MSLDPSHDKNPFEVLGLQGTEDLPAIRKAFLGIAARSHPDRQRTKSPEEKAQALELFLAAKKAFEVLSQPDKRREWSERMGRTTPPPEAPVPPRPRTPPAAVQLPPEPKAVPRASPLPAAAALQLYKLGLLALESSDYGKALELFSRAAKLSPTPRHQAMELVCRGHQYLSTRFFERARESFERALQLMPECREARLGLELLDKQSGRYLKGR